MSLWTLPSCTRISLSLLFLPHARLTSLPHDLALTFPSTHTCRFVLTLRFQGSVPNLSVTPSLPIQNDAVSSILL